MSQNMGNINYSFDTNIFNRVFVSCIGTFLVFYYLISALALSFIFNIRCTEYKYPLGTKLIENEKISLFFSILTLNSPFHIIEKKLDDKIIGNKKKSFMGLALHSYIFIVIAYVITFIILIEGLLRNLLFSIYVNIIQANPNNNPNHNSKCVNKTDIEPNSAVSANYFSILGIGLLFLLPFGIPFIKYIIGFDEYDIKKSTWLNYVILFLIFSPFIITLLAKASFDEKLSIFPDLKKFISTKDYPFINYNIDSFNLKISTFMIYLAIILIFVILVFIYLDYQFDKIEKRAYAILFFVFFFILFIPIFLIYFCFLNIFSAKIPSETNNEVQTEKNIYDNGVNSFYELLIKYNYPGFRN